MARRRCLLILALAVACTLTAPFLGWAVAAQERNGRIEGQLVPQGGASGVAGTPILLTIATGAAQPAARTTTAGDDGRFRFEDLPLGARDIYLLRVTYDGGNYFQEVAFENGATTAQAAPIELYPATRDTEAISFPRLRTIFSTIDQTGIGVVENGAFRNGGDRAYIGPPDAGDARSLRFGLPAGASLVQPAQGLNRNTLVELEGDRLPGFATLEAIPPGERQFAYIYRLAPRDRTLTFERVFPHRTDLFQLYLPAGTRVEGAGATLRDGGETELPNGQRYRIYIAQNLAPDTRLTARLTNLPTGDDATNPLLPALAVFTLVLGVGLILVYGRRRRASPAPAAATRGLRTVPGGRTAPRATRPAGTNGPARAGGAALEERRRRLLLELVELDERYEAGGLAEPEYRRGRAARKDELVGVLRELGAKTAGGDRRPRSR